jgi:hypothetical protein
MPRTLAGFYPKETKYMQVRTWQSCVMRLIAEGMMPAPDSVKVKQDRATKAARRNRGDAWIMAHLRGAHWLAKLVALVALLVPAQAAIFHGIALSAIIDGPMVLCGVRGGEAVTVDDTSSAPASGIHDCCGHCLAASAPPFAGVPAVAEPFEPVSRASAQTPMASMRGHTPIRVRNVQARAPPRPQANHHALTNSLMGEVA